jgi:hypothetical protein
LITPDGATERPRPRIDSVLMKAIARAHRRQRMLKSGECGSITDLAAAEKIRRSNVCRLLRLALLAPDIVEAFLDGRQRPEVSLARLREPLPTFQ